MASIARTALRAAALISGAGTAGLAATPFVAPDSGLARTVQFWSGVMPIYAHYKLVEWRVAGLSEAEATAYYKPLHDRYSPIVERMTVRLQGFYYKLAQVASTRDEFMPDEYMVWAKRLQTRSPNTLPADEIRAVVERSLGRPVDEIFDRFDEAPIGAASIGQVHRARLRESGEEVAVKVQFPGIETKFRADIGTVEKFCVNFMPQNAPFFREIKKQFATEFDYVGEARNLAEVLANLAESQFARDVAVPRPFPELCSKDVLVMSYLPGERMVDGVRERYRKIAEARGIDLAVMEAEQKALMKEGKRQRSDIRSSAQSAALLSWAAWLRDSSMNAAIWVANWTLAPLLWGKGWQYWHTELPVNLGAILETLLRVHAHEIFFGGAFNADCHPVCAIIVSKLYAELIVSSVTDILPLCFCLPGKCSVDA